MQNPFRENGSFTTLATKNDLGIMFTCSGQTNELLKSLIM